MLSRRLVSAAVGIPLLILVIAAGGWLFDAVLVVALGLACFELLIQVAPGYRSPAPWLAGLAAAAFALTALAGPVWSVAALTVFLVAALCLAAIGNGRERSFDDWFRAITISLYIGWLGQYLGLLRRLPNGSAWLFFALFATFASDTAAYAVGRVLGRHLLAPRVSPAKTIEGAVGGLVVTPLAAVAINRLLGPREPMWLMLAAGFGVSLAAQAGDLIESALKRSLSIKDAGRLVPGHGGLLDRLDSLLLVGLMVYWLVKWISL
jgi:phosphatidate cytidylyltransferase